RNRTDRIVDLDLVEEEDGKDDERTGKKTDDDRGSHSNRVSTGSDADETGENAVEAHGEIRLFEQNPGKEDRADTPGRCSQRRGHEHVGNATRISAEHR